MKETNQNTSLSRGLDEVQKEMASSSRQELSCHKVRCEIVGTPDARLDAGLVSDADGACRWLSGVIEETEKWMFISEEGS